MKHNLPEAQDTFKTVVSKNYFIYYDVCVCMMYMWRVHT